MKCRFCHNHTTESIDSKLYCASCGRFIMYERPEILKVDQNVLEDPDYWQEGNDDIMDEVISFIENKSSNKRNRR